jgi:lipid II:glycine glycyltransferase (peptidoglycan interpeptide bridge formation enzyme)
MIIPYFNQSKEWSSFWLQANSSDTNQHDIKYFEDENFATYIYDYPFVFGKRFWYIPRGIIVKNDQIETFLLSPNLHTVESHKEYYDKLTTFLQTIVDSAQENKNVSYVKIEFGEIILPLPLLKTKVKIETQIINKFKQYNFKYKLRQSKKKLQYTQTRVLDINALIKNQASTTVVEYQLQDFWEYNQAWFNQNFDKRTRYGTRKSLQANWRVSKAKSRENFEAFYNLHVSTGKRQNFGVHSKFYLKTLMNMPYSRLIILRDHDEKPQAAWFGIVYNDTLINLYGGNSIISRDSYGQYLLHLAAISVAQENNCRYYDLGGMESGKGYNLFKEGYKGKDIVFNGPFDILLHPLIYNIYNIVRWMKNIKD